MRLYGIKTCDTCRKALKDLQNAGVNISLHDVRAEPLPAGKIDLFSQEFGDALVNRRSTTWRQLTENERLMPVRELISAHPTVMKRPVIEADDGALHLGWSAATKAALLP
ncbi:arsenate reductase family protein [Palleronia caenipelagi]|uniref:Arsenate reductase n=1 Tax=Palleronia caenipelagi TaxID=2489174 RepID=A0A547Q9I6_9RHOB|nr:ArsC/Spx/MgsR family protein [Palleronia caenipelagi]TRD23057.1 arsenate reductase [Palleronia caenipelagi]